VAETSPIPVRLDDQIKARLDAAAKKMGNTRAGVIKLCVSSFLDYFEKHGKAGLPLDWEETLNRLDGRTREARAVSSPYPNHTDRASFVEERPIQAAVNSEPELDVARKAQSDAARLAGVSPGSPPSPGAGGPTARKPRRAGGTGPRSK
jgi:predicted transcriptional regulator